MKKSFLIAVFALLLCANAFATVTVQEDGVKVGEAKKINLSTGLTATRSGGVYTVAVDYALAGSVVTLTPGAAVTLTVGSGVRMYTDTITTDNQDQTINASGTGTAGDSMRIIFITDAAGSADEVITFGTNFRSTGTLTLANAASSRYVVSFVSDGTKWTEVSRTAVQAA